MITVSVPGKIHLMGEHAVVYGKPALLTAINRRMIITIAPARSFEIHTPEPDAYVRYAAEYFAKVYKLPGLPKVKIAITSEIPPGYHLGSSAAVAVGVTGALMYFFKKVWNPAAINQIAYEIEKKQHGNPSGGDNTAETMGGFIWYRRELEFLKSIWQLPFVLPERLNHFSLIDTGRPAETTGEMVSWVKSRVKSQPTVMEKLFDRNEEQTKRITTAIKDGNEKLLIDAMRVGEGTLEEMGVVSKMAMSLIRKIERSGGSAKILGGGGRKSGVGYILAYTHIPPKGSIKITLGAEGVRLDRKV